MSVELPGEEPDVHVQVPVSQSMLPLLLRIGEQNLAAHPELHLLRAALVERAGL
jgi:hypothetical protein